MTCLRDEAHPCQVIKKKPHEVRAVLEPRKLHNLLGKSNLTLIAFKSCIGSLVRPHHLDHYNVVFRDRFEDLRSLC